MGCHHQTRATGAGLAQSRATCALAAVSRSNQRQRRGHRVSGEQTSGAVRDVVNREFGISQPAVSQPQGPARSRLRHRSGRRTTAALRHRLAPASGSDAMARSVPRLLAAQVRRARDRDRARQARSAFGEVGREEAVRRQKLGVIGEQRNRLNFRSGRRDSNPRRPPWQEGKTAFPAVS